MTDAERIKELEGRLAQLEGRIAGLEARLSPGQYAPPGGDPWKRGTYVWCSDGTYAQGGVSS